MATTTYATQAEVKAFLGLGSTQQDDNIDAAIEAVSRSIDEYCGRHFYLDDTASPLVFSAEFTDLIHTPDIGSTTGFLLETDSQWSGVYDMLWVADARTGYGYRLEPVNALAAAEGVSDKPYTKIRALSGEFPMDHYAIQITAQWGWPTVPTPVREACKLWASRIWKRKDAVLGVAGGDDVGFVELARRFDPDIKRSLQPYRKVSVGAV